MQQNHSSLCQAYKPAIIWDYWPLTGTPCISKWFMYHVTKRCVLSGADVVGLNCAFDPTTCLTVIKRMKSALDAAHVSPYLMVQPVAYHCPDVARIKEGHCVLPEYPFGKHGIYGPLARYIKLRVAHAPGMPGTFSPPPQVSDPDMHHGTCVTHVSWCMAGSLTSGFLWSRRRENVPGIPGACATCNFMYLVRGPYIPQNGVYIMSSLMHGIHLF